MPIEIEIGSTRALPGTSDQSRPATSIVLGAATILGLVRWPSKVNGL